MILISVIPEEKKAIVSYPADFKLPQKEIEVFSKADAKQKWECEMRKFIHHTLRQWVIARSVSYVTKAAYTDSRRVAINKLMLMFSYHQDSRLHVLCNRIYKDGKYFVEIFPTEDSRNYKYFKTVIAQILLWCEQYRMHYEEFNNKLIKHN